MTMRRPTTVDSADLAGTLERAERLAGHADRSDLLERLGVSDS